ncbi:MAG TPA: penicillin-binding protein 2 [Verrucomicrobiae bacterium]|nr:penicillin-binding protein 2 [Verrucomicrobiae bacterium]
MKDNPQWRIAMAVAAIVSGLSLLSLRLVQLQVVDHLHYLEKAKQNHTFRRTLPARRGDIVDCAGNLLATTVPLKRVMADLNKMRQILERNRKQVLRDGRERMTEPSQVAHVLAPLLGVPEPELAGQLASRRDLVTLRAELDIVTWRGIADLRLPGIESVDSFKRVYPTERLGSQVVGYVDADGVGRGGVESTMQEYLRGVDGWYQSQKDALLRELRMYRSQDAPAKHGYTVALTLDETVQQIVEEELDTAVLANQAKGACAVVMRPSTGEILAMANRPTFNPNEMASVQWDNVRNRCVQDSYEPGSTFKIVALSAAIETSRVNLNTPVFCENGRFQYGGFTLSDTGSYGTLTVQEAFQKSSNIAFAKLGLQLGARDLYRYARAFGFGDEIVGGMLPAEASGKLDPPEKWPAVAQTRVPIGYGVSVTPLQMASAFCAIANRGVWMRPLLIKEVRNSRGQTVARFAPKSVRQVVRGETADTVLEALEAVVSEHGTGKKAVVPGFTVAGKTGTSKKIDPATKAYSDKRYYSSFIGMLPAREAAFVIVVVIDEPQGDVYYGGLVAGPVFAAMATRIAQHLDLEPVYPRAEVVKR